MGWSAADIPDQRGRLALVTGANSGLGLETSRALLAHGATVLMACRNRERGEAACRSLSEQSVSMEGGVELLDLDLADLESVDHCAQTVRQRFGRLDLLINNAGVMAPPRRAAGRVTNCSSPPTISATWRSPERCCR